MKKIYILISIIALISSCSKSTNEQETTPSVVLTSTKEEVVLTDDQIKLVNLELGKIEKRQISNAVKANGMLDVPPQNLVSISAPLGGFVKHTELLQGMKVKKGQTVVVMEDPDYIQLQQDYLDNKSQLEFLELEYKRQQDLAVDNVNAAKTLQQSKSNYLSTKAKVEGLKAKLILVNINPVEIENGNIKSSTAIPSPISGFVAQVNINIGMHVNPTDILLTIVDTDHLHAEAQVFEKDVSKLGIGQKVRLRLVDETKERLATIYLIGKEITSERTVRVHCHLDEEDQTLIPGMYFSAIIETGNTLATALPNEAIVNFNGKNYIFISSDNDLHRFRMTEIATGISEDGYTTVDLPLTLQQKSIVVKGSYSLLGILKNKAE